MSASNAPYTLISSDTHAGASVEGYRKYLDAKHQAIFDEWRGTYRNPQKQHIGSKKHKNWDDAERMRDLESEGVVGEIVFPNTVPPFFRTSVLICGNPQPADYLLRWEGVKAHNRWLKDWCAEFPDQRAGVGIVYLNDLDAAIEEVKWIAKAGLRGGILLPHVPPDCTHLPPLYSPDMDRFWAVCQDHDVVLNHHGGTGSPDYGPWKISLPIRLLETPWFSTRSYAHMLMSGVFERFPKLKYIVTESGCAWVPATLKNLDQIWERVRSGAVGEFQFAEGAMPPHPPSYYAKVNCYYGASAPSRGELAGRHEIGLDHICWGNDYPHYEGTYPHNRATLRHTMHDMPDTERRLILGENAARLYKFDLAKLKPIVERCGPTPAEVSLPLGPAEIPENTHTNAFR